MKIVFAGDSWCKYMPAWTGNVGLAKHLERILDKPIIDIGHPGDSTQRLMSIARRRELEKNLRGCDVLCLSSGGDSIAGEQAVLWLHDNIGQSSKYATDEIMLTNVVNLVVGCYQDICLLRDEIAPNCKIISHTYDCPPVNMLGKGLFGFGPWLKPSLDYCGWKNYNDQHDIVKNWLTFLTKRLVFASQQCKGWKVLNTLGTLSKSDWHNELHPNQDGFKKIAKLFAHEIKEICDERSG